MSENETAHAVAERCVQASDDGTMTFPAVVGLLVEAGFERYHTDLVRHEKTFYPADGPSVRVSTAVLGGEVGRAFSAAGVEAAVRATQAGQISYATFCERITAAGCVAYEVSMVGRRVVYWGRTGESHTEYFPGARS